MCASGASHSCACVDGFLESKSKVCPKTGAIIISGPAMPSLWSTSTKLILSSQVVPLCHTGRDMHF